MNQNEQLSSELMNDLDKLLQDTGDSIAGMFDQLIKGEWVDSQGHSVAINAQMLQMQSTIIDLMKFRSKYLNYGKVILPGNVTY